MGELCALLNIPESERVFTLSTDESVTLLPLAGMELNFFIADCMGLCSGFVIKES